MKFKILFKILAIIADFAKEIVKAIIVDKASKWLSTHKKEIFGFVCGIYYCKTIRKILCFIFYVVYSIAVIARLTVVLN